MTGLSAPGWPQSSSIHFHVAVKGKPKHMFTWPHTGLTSRRHRKTPDHTPKNWLQACPCHFLLTELIPFLRLSFHL